MLACVLCHFSQEWTSLERPKEAPWPVRRDSHAACCLNYGEENPQLLITGGVDNNGNSLQDAWVLDVKSGTWREVRIYVSMFQLLESAVCRPLYFSIIISLSSLSPAHHSWRCTTSSKAHYYCLKFGAGVDRSHHVWRMPKVEVGKVKWCSTQTSPNYCDGVQWAKHFLLSWLAFRSCIHNYEWCAWALNLESLKKEKSIESGTFWLVGWSYQWAMDPRQRSRNRSSNNSQAGGLSHLQLF